MAANLSNWAENAMADWLLGGSAPVRPTSRNVKLHIGDPGEDGTGNAAANTTRKAVTFAAASGGVAASSSSATWTAVSTTETYSHVSVWDDITAGNCIAYGALTASKAMTAGEDFSIPSGDLSLTLS